MSLKRAQQILTKVLAVIVLIAAVGCLILYAMSRFWGFNYDGKFGQADLAANVSPDESITNIALFGLDARNENEPSRADCIMIVTIDNTRGKIKLTSIMRDSLVPIDGYGSDKINAAYFHGDADLAVRTINEAFETNISAYVAVDMEQLASIIDAMEGLQIDVKSAELEELNRVIDDYGMEQGKTFAIVNNAGLQELNGVQAMCYSRVRKGGTGDDWGRVERQSVVLQALFEKAKDLSANQLLRLMQTLMPHITSSMTLAEMAPLAVGAVKNGVPELSHMRLPLDGEWEYSGSSGQYISYDLDSAARTLYQFIYDDIDFTSVQNTIQADENLLGDKDLNVSATDPSTDGDNSDTDPASLAEVGGSYNPETGDYQDMDGDYYQLDEDGNKQYYNQENYKEEHGLD